MQPLVRTADCKEEEARGEQDDGGTGGEVKRIGDKHTAHRAERADQHGIEGHLSEAMGELICGGSRNQDHCEDENGSHGF